jgi:hypothetical protein
MMSAGYERLLLKAKKDRERAEKGFTQRTEKAESSRSSFIFLLNSHAIRLLYQLDSSRC